MDTYNAAKILFGTSRAVDIMCIRPISTALDVPKEFLLFYMCQLRPLHVAIKRQFYIYI